MKAGVGRRLVKALVGMVVVTTISACSSGGGGTTRTGTVVSVMDPYAVSCHVVAADGAIARAANVANSPGRYIFDGKTGLPAMTATGCVDAATGISLPALGSPAPSTDDSGVITPVTTIIKALMAADPSYTASSAATFVASNLGLPTGIDLLNYDPLAETANDVATAIPVQTVSNQLIATMIMLGAATGDESVVVEALVTAIQDNAAGGAGSILDLTNVTKLSTIAANAGVNPAAITSIANAIAKVNEQIVQAAATLNPVSPSYDPNAVLQDVLIIMSAATIVADILIPKIVLAESGDTSELDAILASIPSLVQTAESQVDINGLSSVPVTVDNTPSQTGATGASS